MFVILWIISLTNEATLCHASWMKLKHCKTRFLRHICPENNQVCRPVLFPDFFTSVISLGCSCWFQNRDARPGICTCVKVKLFCLQDVVCNALCLQLNKDNAEYLQPLSDPASTPPWNKNSFTIWAKLSELEIVYLCSMTVVERGKTAWTKWFFNCSRSEDVLGGD